MQSQFKKLIKSDTSRVNEGHCDVAGAIGGGKAFMEVSQSSWVHEGPTFPWWIYGTVIPMETATPTLMGKKKILFAFFGKLELFVWQTKHIQ